VRPIISWLQHLPRFAARSAYRQSKNRLAAPDVSRLGSWVTRATRFQVLLGAPHYTASTQRVGVLMRVFAALIVAVAAFVSVLAPPRPILAKPTLFGIVKRILPI
jgi:hypothetical protein